MVEPQGAYDWIAAETTMHNWEKNIELMKMVNYTS